MLQISPRKNRPTASGLRAALLVGLCLALSAVLIPVGAHLPRWVEYEIVLGAWWIIWFAVLSWMLHENHEVEDDADPPQLDRLRNIPYKAIPDALDSVGCLSHFDSCAGAIIMLIAMVLIAFGVPLIFELIIPGLAFFIYLALRGMITSAVNDKHGCDGNAGGARCGGDLSGRLYTPFRWD